MDEPSRDQKRAMAAFKAVSDAEAKPYSKDYGRQCLRLPLLIRQDGLCLTLAFLEGKAKKSDSGYFERLLGDFQTVLGTTPAKVREAEASEYQRLSREGLRTALWFKRYAEAVLHVSPDDDRGEG